VNIVQHSIYYSQKDQINLLLRQYIFVVREKTFCKMINMEFYDQYMCEYTIPCEKRFAIFQSTAGMSLTKDSLGENNLMYSVNYSLPGRVWLMTSRLGTGKS
jgi:hypothetical protein